MVLPKSKKSVGLGSQLMRDRLTGGKGNDRKRGSAVARVDHASGEQYLTNDKKQADWVKMRSVTQQGALDEFLATAELAGTDFTAEKITSVKIIHTDQKNPYLLTSAEESQLLGKHKQHRGKLTVPRRPQWDASTTPDELAALERASFLSWRRGLAELEENNDLLMTPFERNLEVWRQLWRVIERSDLIVQIVDARSPLLFRSDDLENYVKDIDPRKENLLLINKADMLTLSQRKAWAEYLKEAGIKYKFFSAHLAKEANEAELSDDYDSEEEEEDEEEDGPSASGKGKQTERIVIEGEESEEDESGQSGDDEARDGTTTSDEEEDVRILTVQELEQLFITQAPDITGSDDPERKLQIGLVGYPNVGKSSTINALIGATKVSVSSTPGKTKHFQTIHLSEKMVLCDCPGLVFPNFATTKADLVCNGVLPIDQMREYTGPCGLVSQRIPKAFLEALYGIEIKIRPAYAKARGFQTQGLGQPDESRAARFILKDYVNGKLLYCHPPPGDYDPREFNRELYDEFHLPENRRLRLPDGRRAALEAELNATSLEDDDGEFSLAGTEFGLGPEGGAKSRNLDRGFFGAGGGSAGHLSRPFSYKYSEQGSKELSGRKAKAAYALANGLDPKDLKGASGKKHFKGGPKNGKKRRAVKVDDD
ncbi:unnamed protein product [Parascedosporium putredinis]|uniref:CP-type G domain-containing protein n=1 Tax=Parascedosporium putredinis TaxID=1442378 RepID=A0A9P1GZK8_9PEZI|nr:unnamed protein product [Parascedosporium putredinis]CAI7992985.1 unnamed protein product [Parascedosporium putredinis]